MICPASDDLTLSHTCFRKSTELASAELWFHYDFVAALRQGPPKEIRDTGCLPGTLVASTVRGHVEAALLPYQKACLTSQNDVRPNPVVLACHRKGRPGLLGQPAKLAMEPFTKGSARCNVQRHCDPFLTDRC